MDPIPEIPASEAINDTVGLIRNTFEEQLENEEFPSDIAYNIRTYGVDDNLSLKETANNAFTIYRCLEEDNENLNNDEYNIIKQHTDYLFIKSSIEKNEFLQEIIKLKPCDIFTNLYSPDKVRIGLIEKSDLYPDLIKQYFDYRFNSTLHQCKRCFSKESILSHQLLNKSEELNRKAISQPKGQKDSSKVVNTLVLEPSVIWFKNFELGHIYKQTVKVRNFSTQMQKVSIRTYPKPSIFRIEFEACQKICPGMYATGTITFIPKMLLNMQDQISFISRKGEKATLSIKCYRDPPKLSVYVQRVLEYPKPIPERIPGNKDFSIKRQHAVNNTFDCGSCFATEHVLTAIILSNSGSRAKFFLISEKDFCYQDINTVSTKLELTKGDFWVYPTFFEMARGDICEIHVLYQPLYSGLQTQMFYLMCDNNTYQQIELVGDAICFNQNLISIDVVDHMAELEKKEGHRIFLGNVNYKEIATFTLSVSNKSSVFLKYYVNIEDKNEKLSMSKWLKIVNKTTNFLPPYSITDLVFELKCTSDEKPGYYNAYLRFFAKDIPIASLESEEKFRISTNSKTLEEITENMLPIDVLILETEVACYVDTPKEVIEEERVLICDACGVINCTCAVCKEIIPTADLEFSEPFLEFGILPVGADICKDFQIENLGNKDQKWTIVELKYNIDTPPYIKPEKVDNNLSLYSGFLAPDKKQSITYNIKRKKPARYVSILVLFKITKNKENQDLNSCNVIAESICVVTHEIIEMNIIIKTGQSCEPILCPLQMLYTNVPVQITFKIKNYSLIPGCFYFLKPIGLDASKIDVEYQPQSGELKAGGAMKIHLKLTCYQMGILENIFLPCFIGKNQEPIQLRLLCVVDCVHVFFYIPSKNNECHKILWPPKVIYEYDKNWSDHCMCGELSVEYENTISSIQSKHTVELTNRSSETVNKLKNSKISIDNETEVNSDKSVSESLLKTLASADSNIFLQDCVMEVNGVVANEPKKVTIYFENVTPKSAKYSVQSTNYSAKKNHIKTCLGPKFKKTEALWEPMIVKHGILIQAEKGCSYMLPSELVSVNIWIYANTWGIYSEEIIIDIENIISFSFSLIVEVVGSPLVLPLSLGAITRYPTLRFGSLAFQSEPTTRNVVVRNVCSIDVTVSWHVFYFTDQNEDSSTTPFNVICDIIDKSGEEKFELNITNRFLGYEGFDCIEIQPRKLNIMHGQELSIPIIFNPKNVQCADEKCPIRCFILGRIFTNQNDRLKSNYFYRKTNSLIIEVTATLEMPRLNVEFEDDTLRIYANDIAIKRKTDYYIRCILRNTTMSVVKVELDCLEPFSIEQIDPIITLEAGKCKEINLPCLINYEKILKWAPYVYKLITETKEMSTTESTTEMKLVTKDDRIVDYINKILIFHKKLYMYFPGGFKNVIPLNIHLYYPNITVKPIHVKFGYILLGQTQKAIVSIYNLTGCAVLFEIYKSLSTQEIVVTPPHGEIDKSTGMNHSFTNISVYFTPTACKMYHESIRVLTNIPQCYIDIPIKGTGSYNEKFK